MVVRPMLQVLVVLLAVCISLTRVSDYKHHWADVLAGGVLGTVVAFVSVCKYKYMRHLHSYELQNWHYIHFSNLMIYFSIQIKYRILEDNGSFHETLQELIDNNDIFFSRHSIFPICSLNTSYVI